MNGKQIGRKVLMVIGGFFVFGLIALVFGFIVRALWNWLMPTIFGLTEITYWQAWGLVLLSHILIKGDIHRDSNGGRHNPEWKHGFKDRMRKRFAGKQSHRDGSPCDGIQPAADPKPVSEPRPEEESEPGAETELDGSE